jgi:hypothetical protein
MLFSSADGYPKKETGVIPLAILYCFSNVMDRAGRLVFTPNCLIFIAIF